MDKEIIGTKYLKQIEKILQTLYDGDKPDIREVVDALNKTIKLQEHE